MRIAVIGRGHVGGGLADLWERAGHEVTRIGREGGDVSGAEVALVAVPGGAIGEALEKVKGLEGKTVIDATNLYGDLPPDGFPSNAEFVKSKAKGPTAKAFNLNFAALYPRLGEARARPSDLWCGDAEAREVVEQLNRDAGYDPVYMGPIEPRLRPGSDERGHRRQSAEKWARTSFGSHRLSCCDLSLRRLLGFSTGRRKPPLAAHHTRPSRPPDQTGVPGVSTPVTREKRESLTWTLEMEWMPSSSQESPFSNVASPGYSDSGFARSLMSGYGGPL